MDRDTVYDLRPGPETNKLIARHIFNQDDDAAGYLLYSTEIKSTWFIVEKLRSKSYLVNIKLMPLEGSFIIEGSRSEYDDPCPDREAFKGNTVVELMLINKNKSFFYKNIFAHDPDPLMAICRAALLLYIDGGLK